MSAPNTAPLDQAVIDAGIALARVNSNVSPDPEERAAAVAALVAAMQARGGPMPETPTDD